MIEQGTPEWFAQRCGRVTASRISDIMARTKSGPAASRKNYMAELVIERLSGEVQESYTNGAMQWGSDTEPQALEMYGFMRNVELSQAPFIPHTEIEMAGASPDTLVGDDGLAEFKCPNSATHLEYLQGGNVDKRYRDQMQFQMDCTGRAWCDFVSFDPRLPPAYQMHIRRFERDGEGIAEIRKSVIAFLEELDSKVQALRCAFEPEAVMEAAQ